MNVMTIIAIVTDGTISIMQQVLNFPKHEIRNVSATGNAQ